MIAIDDYVRPKGVAEAIATLRDHPDRACVLAGGQSVLLRRDADVAAPSRLLVDLGDVDELREIRVDDQGLVIGSMVTIDELEQSPLVRAERPDLAEVGTLIGDPQVRNRCTVGGSLASAFPSGHLSTFTLVHDAELEIETSGGRYMLPATEFFRGTHRTALAAADVIVGLRLPRRAEQERSGFAEFRRSAISESVVNVAVSARPDHGVSPRLRVAAGGVTDRPIRLVDLEHQIVECSSEDDLSRAIADALRSCAPPPLVHATPAYRRAIAEVLLMRTIRDVHSDRSVQRPSGEVLP